MTTYQMILLDDLTDLYKVLWFKSMSDYTLGLQQSNYDTEDLTQWQLKKWSYWMTLLISIKYSKLTASVVTR